MATKKTTTTSTKAKAPAKKSTATKGIKAYATEQQRADAISAQYAKERLAAYGPSGQLDAEVRALFGKSPKSSRKAVSVGGGGNSAKARANKALAKSLTKQSFLLEIQGLTNARDSLLDAAKTNVLRQQRELDITLEEAARQFASVSSAQRAAAGASGLLMNSQSFLDVYAETATQYTIQTSRLKETTRINQESLYKESLLKAEEFNIEINSTMLEQRLQDLMIDNE